MSTVTANGLTWNVGQVGVVQGVVAAGGGSGDDYGDGPTTGLDVIFLADDIAGFPAPNAWHNVSVAHLVPPGTLAINLNAILIETAGTIQQGNTGAVDQDVRFQFATTGARPPLPTYCWQMILSLFTGVRQTASVWVALDANLSFDWIWMPFINGKSDFGTYPVYPTIGLHAFINAILLPS